MNINKDLVAASATPLVLATLFAGSAWLFRSAAAQQSRADAGP